MIIAETPRLVLRSFSLDDADAYFEAILSNPLVMRFLPGGDALPYERVHPMLERFIAHQEQHSFSIWAVEDRADRALIGHAGLLYMPDSDDIELAYALRQSSWGQGLATEAAQGCLRYGFDTLGLERIVAVFVRENTGSEHVMIKLGMTFQGDAPAYNTILPMYAITRDEFLARGS